MVYTGPQYTTNQFLRSSIASTKGLFNFPGQNNCFLNCAVQVSQNKFKLSFFYQTEIISLFGTTIKSFFCLIQWRIIDTVNYAGIGTIQMQTMHTEHLDQFT